MSIVYPVQAGEGEHIGQLIHQRLVSEGHPDVGDVGSLHVVTGDAREMIVGPEPVLLGVIRETRLEDGVTGDLTEVTTKMIIRTGKMMIVRLPGEFPDLGSNAVLFHQRFLGEVKL